MAQDLLFLEFQNEHLSIFDPCPKEFADFFSEFFDHVFIVPFFFKDLRENAHLAIFRPRRALSALMLHACVIYRWNRLKKIFKMNTNMTTFIESLSNWKIIEIVFFVIFRPFISDNDAVILSKALKTFKMITVRELS